jgi:hypothetical protein
MTTPPVRDFVYQNDVDPAAVRIALAPTNVDPTTFTSAAIHVHRPDESLATWAATLENVTSTSADAVHVFETGDLPNAPEILAMYVQCETPSGPYRSDTTFLLVRPRYE